MEECNERWKQDREDIQQMGSFNPNNMKVEMERLHKYIKCIKNYGDIWIGMKFHYPMIWLPTREYHNEFKLSKRKNWFARRKFKKEEDTSMHMKERQIDYSIINLSGVSPSYIHINVLVA